MRHRIDWQALNWNWGPFGRQSVFCSRPECRRLRMSRLLTYIMIGKSEMFNKWAITNLYQNRRDLQMIAFSGNSSSISLNIPEPMNWMSHYWKLLILVISKVQKLGFHMQWHACKFGKSTLGPGWGGSISRTSRTPWLRAWTLWKLAGVRRGVWFGGLDRLGGGSIDWQGGSIEPVEPPGYGHGQHSRGSRQTALSGRN